MMKSAKASRNSRFQRGSGVFACGCCARRTRDTGGDNTGVELCAECYELAGIENQISDYGDSEGKLAVWEAEAAALRIKIVALGGVLR